MKKEKWENVEKEDGDQDTTQGEFITSIIAIGFIGLALWGMKKISETAAKEREELTK